MEKYYNRIKNFLDNEKDFHLGEEFYYDNLDLCIIDAVFSISVNYEQVKNVIKNYEKKYMGKSLFEIYSSYNNDFNKISEELFNNKGRTSTSNGILKSEAVFLFKKVLSNYGILNLKDFNKKKDLLSQVEEDIKKIPGQKSGISFRYFCMLAGDKSYFKPDRMILRFFNIDETKGGDKSIILSIQNNFDTLINNLIKNKYFNDGDIGNYRKLDFIIWNLQRNN